MRWFAQQRGNVYALISFTIAIFLAFLFYFSIVPASIAIGLLFTTLCTFVLLPFVNRRTSDERVLIDAAQNCGLKNLWVGESGLFPEKDKAGKLLQVLDEAHDTAFICGLTLNHFAAEHGVIGQLDSLLSKKGEQFRLHILLLNPHSEYATAHQAIRDVTGGKNFYKETARTIDSLKKAYELMSPKIRRQIEIKLTNYMPRFRYIDIDAKYGYVHMYLFKSDVANNPVFKVEKERENNWYTIIGNSVKAMYELEDNVILTRDGVWNSHWEKDATKCHLKSCLSKTCNGTAGCTKWKNIEKLILGGEDHKHPFLPKNYEAGTFLIAERDSKPSFLCENERDLSLEDWLKVVTNKDILDLQKMAPSSIKITQEQAQMLPQQVVTTMKFKPQFHRSLAELTWNQEYSDVIRRVEMWHLTGNPEYDIDAYQEINAKWKKVAITCIQLLESDNSIGLSDWYRLSVAAGLMALDEKSELAATSFFRNEQTIRWDAKLNTGDTTATASITERLKSIIHKKHRIDFADKYIEDILNSGHEYKVVSFPDDFVETIFLLKFYEMQLEKNHHLQIDCVPRSCRVGNDATYHDVMLFLKENIFKKLSEFEQKERFRVHSEGPTIGGLNLRRLSPKIADIVEASDYLDIRGARAYEMTQGINKDVYYGFVVCREMSESVTGLDGESGHLVILKQNSGDRSFEGFRQRAGQIKKSPSGREFMVAQKTALDYCETLKT